MSFGEKLKHRRESLGLTQEALSSTINEELSRQAVSKWERDETYPEVEKLLVLATKFNISLDELFADELAYLKRKEKTELDYDKLYPGLMAGMKTFAEALKKLK